MVTIPSGDEIAERLNRLTLPQKIEWEQAHGQSFGAHHQAWLQERAPEKVLRLLAQARERPDIAAVSSNFTVSPKAPPFSHTAIATTVTETYLWIPGQYSAVAVGDPEVGKVYEVTYTGIVSTTATPTIANTFRWHGATTTTVGGVSLGASVAGTTATGLANVPFFGNAFVAFRSLGLAATSATVVAAGATNIAGAAGTAPSFTLVFGTNSTATVDTYTAANMGLGIGWTWGTSSASNTVTCQLVVFSSWN